MNQRPAVLVAGFAALALVLGGCGVSVAAGGQDAATHPASGIYAAPTEGAGVVPGIKGRTVPTVAYRVGRPPASAPLGLVATAVAVKTAVTGGCWQDAHEGNVYGAYDQLFWWQGECGDTVGQVTVELYPTAAAAGSETAHRSDNALLARYRAGAVLVDVYANAPQWVVTQLTAVKGLKSLPGYGG